MALASEAKGKVISQFRVHKTDTGSPEVQVAILSRRIKDLMDHFGLHAKDHHSRRGLLQMVARRRRLLDYLRSRSPERYKTLIQSLGIRR
jgi:small subunit ribosomal protein S15